MVSATVSTERDDDHVGFQGVAEPVVLPDDTLPQALPQTLPQSPPQPLPPLRSQPTVAPHPAPHPAQHAAPHPAPHHAVPYHPAPQHSTPHHSSPQHTPHIATLHAPHPTPQQQLKKASNASASPMTTAEPQPSTTSSDRISTWILLSGTHSTATTPSSLKKRPTGAPVSTTHPAKEDVAPVASAAPGGHVAPAAAPKVPAGHKPSHAQRPPPAVRKPVPAQRVPGRKPTPTSTTTTTAAPTSTSTTPKPAPPTSPQSPEYVKISEAVVSAAPKDKPEPKKPVRPAVLTESKQAVKRPAQDKTKVSSASVPFSPAISFRRKPVQGQPIQALPEQQKVAKPVAAALKTTSTTPAPTTTTPTPEELTTLPPTQTEIATTDADLSAYTTTMPTVTTKKPKRAGSTSSKKKKKKKKNKTRRRRPTKKTSATSATSTVAPESKIGNELNGTKVGQNGISTKIYNYLAREVMPSVSVGIIGLVVTAGIAGLFLYPFGGGIAARR